MKMILSHWDTSSCLQSLFDTRKDCIWSSSLFTYSSNVIAVSFCHLCSPHWFRTTIFCWFRWGSVRFWTDRLFGSFRWNRPVKSRFTLRFWNLLFFEPPVGRCGTFAKWKYYFLIFKCVLLLAAVCFIVRLDIALPFDDGLDGFVMWVGLRGLPLVFNVSSYESLHSLLSFSRLPAEKNFD